MKFYSVLAIFLLALVLQTRASSHESLEEDEVDCLYQKPDCFCMEYEHPVCATNGCNYSNPCQMSCADEKIAYEGVCLDEQAVILPTGEEVVLPADAH